MVEDDRQKRTSEKACKSESNQTKRKINFNCQFYVNSDLGQWRRLQARFATILSDCAASDLKLIPEDDYERRFGQIRTNDVLMFKLKSK